MAKRVSLLGVGVHAIDLAGTLDEMQAAIEQKRKGTVCLAPAHNLMAARRDPQLRGAINRSLLTVPDGMGTVWFLRLLGHQAGRVYGPDLMLAAARRGVAAGWRHLLIGGSEEAVVGLQKRLDAAAPGMIIAGAIIPPFNAEPDDTTMTAGINSHNADIAWVALGSPRQELWMERMRSQLNVTLLVGVGAAFDFLSGAKKQAPPWIQRAGLEWLFRLISEPRRLWRRYAEYPLFVLLLFAQWLGLAKYPLEQADA